ncbi:hypothetical protein [Streptomyces sp. CAI-85]|uniref:hypothetical protein n=1 Tax=Streptomyces TaxID=1883 RepID=UPI0020CA59A7|nr:hypothetical protein [Streptomyces sp. CAI-85]
MEATRGWSATADTARKVAADVLRWADSGRLPDRIGPALHEALTTAGPARPGRVLIHCTHPAPAGDSEAPEPTCVGTDGQPG